MPLFRVETRVKEREPAKPREAAPARGRAREADRGGLGLLPALAGGAVIGLILVVSASAYLVYRDRQAPAPAPVPAAPGDAAAAAAAPLAPGPINADYAREAQIAIVNGEPYTMAQLETAVRVARALGTVGGDAVPAYGTPEMKQFQVTILKRQIDMILMKQALVGEGLTPPTGPVDDLIQGYLQRVGASDAQLQAELARNSVGRAELVGWFEDARSTGYFVQEKLLAGQDPSQREAVTEAWLAQAWADNEEQILINFYEPEPAQP